MSCKTTNTAFVFLNIKTKANEKIIFNEINDVPETVSICKTFGKYDFVIKLSANNMERIREAVLWKIRKIDGINNTMVLLKNQLNGAV